MKNLVMVLTLLAAVLFLPLQSHAEEPDVRVARASYINGDVSYQRGDDEGWNALGMNTPLLTGDSLYTSDGARAEVSLGSGNVVRLDGGTQVDLVNNTWEVAQLGVSGGYLNLRARSVSRNYTLEIDTPNAAATILEPGLYRVEVTDRMARYSVVEGSMSVALDGQQLDVNEGESLELEGPESPTYSYMKLPSRRPFDGWADSRDIRAQRSSSSRHVHASVVGYEDLDDHGSWRKTRAYGWVWTPSGMSAGWAPYRSGSWIWQDPYGWTWVSDEPWGWAPYHYGRWVWERNCWGWVPPPPMGYRGPAVVMSIRPVYAPALVAFVGGRNWHVGITIGGPAIGWVPLAPAESYYYPWQPAPRVTNRYTNITVINAVTVVNYNTFATGVVRPIQVPRGRMKEAPVIGYTAAGVVPTHGSLVAYPERNISPKTFPRGAPKRPLVARLLPPPKPLPFDQKLAVIEKTGRPVARPVAIGSDVGKPFKTGVIAPEGVSAVSALGREGRKELRARPGSEARAPKRIEEDFARPVQRGDRGGFGRVRASGESPGESRPANDPRIERSTSPASGTANDKAAVDPGATMSERPGNRGSRWQARPASGDQPTGNRLSEKGSGPGEGGERIKEQQVRPVSPSEQPQRPEAGNASDKAAVEPGPTMSVERPGNRRLKWQPKQASSDQPTGSRLSEKGPGPGEGDDKIKEQQVRPVSPGEQPQRTAAGDANDKAAVEQGPTMSGERPGNRGSRWQPRPASGDQPTGNGLMEKGSGPGERDARIKAQQVQPVSPSDQHFGQRVEPKQRPTPGAGLETPQGSTGGRMKESQIPPPDTLPSVQPEMSKSVPDVGQPKPPQASTKTDSKKRKAKEPQEKQAPENPRTPEPEEEEKGK